MEEFTRYANHWAAPKHLFGLKGMKLAAFVLFPQQSTTAYLLQYGMPLQEPQRGTVQRAMHAPHRTARAPVVPA